MKPTRIELLWPNGAVTSGSSWEEVEAAIRAAQPRAYPSRRAFRAEMRRRAKEWSGRHQKPYPPWNARAFVQSLANAEMFMIVKMEDPE